MGYIPLEYFQYNVNEIMNCFLCIESSKVDEYFVTNPVVCCIEFFSDRKILVLSFKRILFSYCSHLLQSSMLESRSVLGGENNCNCV